MGGPPGGLQESRRSSSKSIAGLILSALATGLGLPSFAIPAG